MFPRFALIGGIVLFSIIGKPRAEIKQRQELQSGPREVEANSAFIQDSFDSLLLGQLQWPQDLGFDEFSAALWNKLRAAIELDAERKAEHDARALLFGDKRMRYFFQKLGTRPENGFPLYIALHGGGGTTRLMNTSQWYHIQMIYNSNIDTGIYVVPRGVTNTWDLHFVDESYVLYDRMIANMIAMEGVDPNRVYIMGFSAGGDGVWQVAPRMADRWAATSMSAGHYNWVNLLNIRNVPLQIQMGEHDKAYRRNTASVEAFRILTGFAARFGGYETEIFLHHAGSHNSWLSASEMRDPMPVIADPIAWLESEDRTHVDKETAVVPWLDRYVREPLPMKVVWHTRTSSPRTEKMGERYLADAEAKNRLSSPRDLFYWLDQGVNNEKGSLETIVASYRSDAIAIEFTQIGSGRLRILLSHKMVDLNAPIAIVIRGKTIAAVDVTARPSEVTIESNDEGQWQLVDTLDENPES